MNIINLFRYVIYSAIILLLLWLLFGNKTNNAGVQYLKSINEVNIHNQGRQRYNEEQMKEINSLFEDKKFPNKWGYFDSVLYSDQLQNPNILAGYRTDEFWQAY